MNKINRKHVTLALLLFFCVPTIQAAEAISDEEDGDTGAPAAAADQMPQGYEADMSKLQAQMSKVEADISKLEDEWNVNSVRQGYEGKKGELEASLSKLQAEMHAANDGITMSRLMRSIGHTRQDITNLKSELEATLEFKGYKRESQQLDDFWEQLQAQMSKLRAQLKTPESPQNIEDTPVTTLVITPPTTQTIVGAGGLLREEIGDSVGSAPAQPTGLKEDSRYQRLEVPQKADKAKQPTTQAKVGSGVGLEEEIDGSFRSAPDQPTELKEDPRYQQPTRSGSDSNKANPIDILGKVAAVIVVFVIAIGVILYFRFRANKTLWPSLKTPFEIPFGEIMRAVFRAMR